MDPKDLIARKLDAKGCRYVGAKIATNTKSLENKGELLASKLKEAINQLQKITEELSSADFDETPMSTVDRDTDICVAAFRDAIAAKLKILRPIGYLSLSEPLGEIYQSASSLEQKLFAEGTGYLKKPHHEQWAHLDSLQRNLLEPATATLIETAKLRAEAERVLQCIEFYGKRLGVTEVQENLSDKLKELVDSWHLAYSKVALQALAAYDTEEAHQQRALFTLPYEEVQEREREQERQYREDLKKRKEKP